MAEEVNVSAGWRWVCQLYQQPMPNFRTIRDREALLKPRAVSELIYGVTPSIARGLYDSGRDSSLRSE
jgi:hypothetical protein